MDERCSGISIGGRNPGEYGDSQVLIQQNIIDHNGWYQQAFKLEGTATSGSTINLVNSGTPFAGLNLVGVSVQDQVNGGIAVITANTDSTVSFGVTANVDFTGGGAWRIGGGWLFTEDRGGGQATQFNHNIYTRGPKKQIIEQNIISRSSSIAIKLTSDSGNIDGTSTGGGTTTMVESGAGFTPDEFVGWHIQDRVTEGWAQIVSNTTDTIVFGSPVSGTLDFTGGRNYRLVDEGDGNTPAEDFIEQHNIIIDCEIGIGGGGNTDYDLDHRFTNHRVCENVITRNGYSNPTNRSSVAWGSGAADWINGLLSGNISTDFFLGANGPFGYSVSGHAGSLVIAKNISHNTSGDNTTNGQSGGIVVSQDADFFPSGVYILKNDFKEEGQATVVGGFPSAQVPNITLEGNRYDAARDPNTAAILDGSATTLAAFIAATGETGATVGNINYNDTGASIENYQRLRGGTATVEAFIDECLLLSKENRDSTLDALEVFGYFKECYTDKPDIRIEAKTLQFVNGTPGDITNIAFTRFADQAPKAIIVIKPDLANEATNNGTYSYGLSVGFADADGNQWCAGLNVDSDQPPNSQDCSGQQNTTHVLSFCQRGYWGLADENWFTPNQVSLQLVDKGIVSESFTATVIAIGGDDVVSAKVDFLDDLAAAASSFAINTGNRPDFRAFSGVVEALRLSLNLRTSADSRLSWGFAIDGKNGVEQMGNASYSDSYGSAENTQSNVATAIYNDAVFAKITHPSTEVAALSIDAMTTTGAIATADAAFANELLGFLAIEFARRPLMSMSDTTIAAASDINETGPAFRPGFCLWQLQEGSLAYNTPEAADHSHGIFTFDGLTGYTANYGFGEENQANLDGMYAGGGGDDITLYTKQRRGLATIDVDGNDEAFTASGIAATLTNQAGENIPGRILAMAVN